MLLWVRHQVHSDLIHVDVEVTLEPHGAGHIVDQVSDNRVLLLKVVFFLFSITCFDQRATILDRCRWFLSEASKLTCFRLLVLFINARYYVEQSLIVDW